MLHNYWKIAWFEGRQVRKTVFFSHIYVKTNILPRQARDKHRENSKQTVLLRRMRSLTPSGRS
jgi:hypothetical protein